MSLPAAYGRAAPTDKHGGSDRNCSGFGTATMLDAQRFR